MTKRLSITVSDFVFDTYLSEKYNNRSQFIEKLIVLGAESMLGEHENYKARYLKLLQEKTDADSEIKALKLKVGRQSTLLDNRPSQELIVKTKFSQAIKNSGFLRDL